MPDPILTEGAAALREVTREVPKEMFKTEELHTLIARMSSSLRAAPHGVAIAANQIGIPYRMFMVRGFALLGNERNDDDPDVVFINPVIVRESKTKVRFEGEGCLSVPDVYGTIERAEKATVRAYDEYGKKFVRGGAGLVAEIFQHEIDHLNGALFIDRAEDLKKVELEKSVAYD